MGEVLKKMLGEFEDGYLGFISFEAGDAGGDPFLRAQLVCQAAEVN